MKPLVLVGKGSAFSNYPRPYRAAIDFGGGKHKTLKGASGAPRTFGHYHTALNAAKLEIARRQVNAVPMSAPRHPLTIWRHANYGLGSR